MSVSKKCDVYLSFATVSCMSTDRRPHVPPLSLLIDSVSNCIDHPSSQFCSERLTGIVQFIMYVQQGVRHFGVSPIPLSHDANDLLLEMPLLPRQLLSAVVALHKVIRESRRKPFVVVFFKQKKKKKKKKKKITSLACLSQIPLCWILSLTIEALIR